MPIRVNPRVFLLTMVEVKMDIQNLRLWIYRSFSASFPTVAFRVLRSGLMRIRHYGLLANATRRERLAMLSPPYPPRETLICFPDRMMAKTVESVRKFLGDVRASGRVRACGVAPFGPEDHGAVLQHADQLLHFGIVFLI